MATLEKIRTRAGVFISIIIGIALLSFLVNPQDIINYLHSSNNSLGEMNGKKIDPQKFQELENYYSHIYQLRTRQATLSEQAQEEVRNETWNELLRRNVFDEQFEEVGLGVSEAELRDLGAGQNLSPIVKQAFTNPQTGEVDWESLNNFWKNASQDSEQRQVQQELIVYLEDQIKSNSLMTKYIALINKASYVNSLQVKHAVASAANSVEFNYIAERFMGGAEADSLYRIKISEAKDYYAKHKKRYEQEESRDIEFVSFPVIATEEDDANAKSSLEKLVPDFTASTDLVSFVRLNANGKNSDMSFYKRGELSSVLDSFAFSAGRQDVLPPTRDGNVYKIARINDVRMLPDSVRIRNILIPITSTPEAAKKVADSVQKVLQHSDSWSTLAMQYPVDNESAVNGGDAGWFRQADLPPHMVDSCFMQPAGKIMILPSQSGYFVFQVSARTKDVMKVQLAVIQKEITAGKKTYDAAYNKASQLASQAQNGYEAFKKATEESGYVKQLAPKIVRSSKNVLSLTNARLLVNWAYEDKVEKGAVSGVITLENQYFIVAAVTEVRENGIAPFDQVKDQIGEELRKEKQGEALAAKMKEAAANAGGNIQTVAEKLSLTVQSVVDPVTFNSPYIPGLGVEPKVVATATLAEMNKLSEPVIGNSATYMLVVTNKRTDEGYTPEMAKSHVEQMQMMHQGDFYNVLIKTAKVKDLRKF